MRYGRRRREARPTKVRPKTSVEAGGGVFGLVFRTTSSLEGWRVMSEKS
jgi:hypothetical protein